MWNAFCEVLVLPSAGFTATGLRNRIRMSSSPLRSYSTPHPFFPNAVEGFVQSPQLQGVLNDNNVQSEPALRAFKGYYLLVAAIEIGDLLKILSGIYRTANTFAKNL
jgi:hypothetical protein